MRINREQRMYVIPCGNGFTCLGFDVAERRRRAVLAWIGETAEPMRVGTKRHYAAYKEAMARGSMHAKETGKKCPAELNPRLVGLEGRRVEIVSPDGEKCRFYVGRSTGWMPCHLEIARRDSIGGPPVYLPDNAEIRVIR